MKKSTPLTMVYFVFGRYSVEIHAKTRMIKHWSKILTDKDSKISHEIYSVLLDLQKIIFILVIGSYM